MDILAIGDYKVTNDDRIKLEHSYISDWSLTIQPVNEEDAGEYMCQVNTEPLIITRIFLHVLCKRNCFLTFFLFSFFFSSFCIRCF
jgi:hypothetical protein